MKKDMAIYTPDEEIRALYARLSDLIDAAARGEVVMTPFLTPREAKYARRYLAGRLTAGTAVAVGGYPEAERVRMLLLPDYTEGMVSTETLVIDPVTALREAGLEELADEIGAAVIPLKITGSGYRTLTHRDYLGSVLGLGLDRDAVGDIQVMDDRSAYLLCKGEIVDFLLENIQKIGSDTVKVCRLPQGEQVVSMRRFEPVSDTVASERLDCVVAALGNLSREKAQQAVRSGLVELDYETVEACDTTVQPPCTLSVRGIGKFAVRAFDGETRKGRVRLKADKYI